MLVRLEDVAVGVTGATRDRMIFERSRGEGNVKD